MKIPLQSENQKIHKERDLIQTLVINLDYLRACNNRQRFNILNLGNDVKNVRKKHEQIDRYRCIINIRYSKLVACAGEV